MENSFKLDLIKLNLIVLGAVFSAVNIGFKTTIIHIAMGTILLTISTLMLYLSLLPNLDTTSEYFDTSYFDEEQTDWLILTGFTAYTFLILGFSFPYLADLENPYSFDLIPDFWMISILPYVVISIIVSMRYREVRQSNDREVTDLFNAILFFLTVMVLVLHVVVWGYTQ